VIVRCGLLVVAAAVLCGRAGAAQVSFENITWPRHDKDTGVLDWELRASTARPTVVENQYACVEPELTIFKVEEKGGRLRIRKDLYLRSERGTYVHGSRRAKADLAGRVVTELYGAEVVRLITRDATVDATWDKERQERTRLVTSRSPVTMKSKTRDMMGEGMEISQKTTKTGAGDKSVVTIHRNITMEMRGAEVSGALPVVPGAESADAAPAPIQITCLGPLVFDRLAQVASFRNQVALKKGDTTLHCDVLTLTFVSEPDEEPAGKEGAPKTPGAGAALKTLLAEGHVAVLGKDQEMHGDRLTWDPEQGRGVLTGAPARMNAGGTKARAPNIEFSPKADSVTYTGGAVVEIELELE